MLKNLNIQSGLTAGPRFTSIGNTVERHPGRPWRPPDCRRPYGAWKNCALHPDARRFQRSGIWHRSPDRSDLIHRSHRVLVAEVVANWTCDFVRLVEIPLDK